MTNSGSDLLEKEVVSKVEGLLARSAMYQILSACFFHPTKESLSLLKDADFSELVEKLEHGYKDTDKATGFLQSLAELRKSFDSSTIENLQSQYIRIVGHTISKECPFYEGQYGAAHVYQQVQDLADIQGFYKAFGLDGSDVEKERCDHVSVELEFLQFLLYKQAYAIEHDGEEKAQICEDAVKSFIKEHVGKWVPLLATLLAKKAGSGFYFALSVLTKEFMGLEMKLMRIETEMFKESDLTQDVVAGAPDECLSCASSSDEDFGA